MVISMTNLKRYEKLNMIHFSLNLYKFDKNSFLEIK